MSVDVMYQPYSSGFGYQRNNDHTLQSLCLPKTQEPLDLGIYASHASSLGHAVPGTSLGHHAPPISHPSTSLGHTSAGALGHPAGGSMSMKEDEKAEQPKDTQYLTANCVLMTYFSGDISTVVDDHFTRALSQPSSYSPDTQNSKQPKDPSLLCGRKLPPSFWNSHYYSPGSLYPDLQLPGGHYPSASLPGFSGLQDPWFSRLSSQPHTFHHRPMHYDFPYSSMSAAAAGRYNSNLGSLLLQSARSAGHFSSDYAKPTDTKFRYPDYRFGTDYTGQSSFPGLEPSATETSASRDLYLY